MAIDLIGWDIGGAHLKSVALDGDRLVAVLQKPYPLWLGLEHFHAAAREIIEELRPKPGCLHAVTMTGELVDLFANREEGVFGLLHALEQHVEPSSIKVFKGSGGFLAPSGISAADVPKIASANWLATGHFAASRLDAGLLIDIGSTTADFLLIKGGMVSTRGYTDYERLANGELVYCGAVRTSLMSLADKAPFEGEWVGLMAEHFATTADVYRMTGELAEWADQSASADGGEKTPKESARRIARLVGRDLESTELESWRGLAFYFRERQLARLMDACHLQLSRGLLNRHDPVIGAGVGRFLVQELARRLGHPYLDFADLFPMHPQEGFNLADCAPAAAVAFLAR